MHSELVILIPFYGARVTPTGRQGGGVWKGHGWVSLHVCVRVG